METDDSRERHEALETPVRIFAVCVLSWALPTASMRRSRLSRSGWRCRGHMVDQRGEPIFVNGEAAWSITHNLTYDEAVRYLEDRKARGIDALMVSVPDAFAPDGRASYPPDRQRNHPFVENDVSRPNEAYWQHVDRVIGKTEEMGFPVFFWPFYLGCCDDGYMRLFLEDGPAKALANGRYVGRRYGSREEP